WIRFCHPKFPVSKLQRIKQFINRIRRFPMRVPVASQKREGLGIENLLLKHGVWVDLNNRRKAYCFLGETTLSTESREKFEVSLDKNGQIKGLKNENCLQVMHDPDEKLRKSLSCLPQDQILFLRRPGKSFVSQVQFLNQKIYLARDSINGEWQLKGDPQL